MAGFAMHIMSFNVMTPSFIGEWTGVKHRKRLHYGPGIVEVQRDAVCPRLLGQTVLEYNKYYLYIFIREKPRAYDLIVPE